LGKCCATNLLMAQYWKHKLTHLVTLHRRVDLLFDWFGFDQTSKSVDNSKHHIDTSTYEIS